MGDVSTIEWTDSTWNPWRGCSRTSPGCGGPGPHGGCYAERIAARFSGPGAPFEGFAHRVGGEPRWTGKLALVPAQLDLPLRWKKPRRIFVNSMSDLFHESLSVDDITRVFAVMAVSSRHTFQVLTKRADKMRAFVTALGISVKPLERAAREIGYTLNFRGIPLLPWPLPNVWLGVSVEDRPRKNRIDYLRETPAAQRFLSLEPLLEDLGELDLTGIDWVIAGAESGPRARPCDKNWIRDIRDQCAAAGVAFFWKQHVEAGRKISTPELDGVRHIAFPA